MNLKGYAKPFRHWLIDGYKCQSATREAQTAVQKRRGIWKFYSNDLERKRLVDNPASVGPRCAALVRSPYWPALIEEMSRGRIAEPKADPTGHGGSIHAMVSGDYLGTHIDRDMHPTLGWKLGLAIVLFLVPEWKEEWGGSLDFYDDEGRDVVASIYPAPGRIVIWEPGDLTYHGVSEIRPTALCARVTANLFYYYEYSFIRPTRKRALFVPNREHERAML